MVRPYGSRQQVGRKVVTPLALILYLLLLVGIATPDGIAYKPMPKDPPWPPICQMTPDGLPCIPIN